MALSSDYVITALTGKQGIQGDKGDKGTTGASGKSVIAQYSVDGSSSWHSTYTSGDIYMRTSTDSGATWSSAMRIVGEKGATGAKGDKGEKGATGATGAKGLDGIVLKCNVGSLNYTLQRNKKANYEAQSFTLALYQGSTVLTPSSSSITTSNVKNLTVSKSGTSTITITATSAYNGAIPSGYIIATLVYNNVSYSMNIPITTNYNGKYLGLLSALPSSANLGDYFVASKTFSASSTTYTQSFVYGKVCSSSNTYAWIVSTEINSVEVFSDVLSLANASSNTQAVAIVQRLVASDIFVNNLSAQKILFQHFVASSSVNNKAKVGDQIISMGYNPKDSSDTDFSFMIQKCIQEANSSTGQEEVWMKHFWTKFLASGLLTLNLSGCLQTTGDVKTNPASEWSQYNTVSSSIQCVFEDNGIIFLGCKNGNIYGSQDAGKTWIVMYGSSSSTKKNSPVYKFCKTDTSIYSVVRTSDSASTFALIKWNGKFTTYSWSEIDASTINGMCTSMLYYDSYIYIGTPSNVRYYRVDPSLDEIEQIAVSNKYFSYFFSFKEKLYVAGYWGTLYHLSNDNTVQKETALFSGQLGTPCVSDNYIVFSSASGVIYYSTDGNTFKSVQPKLSDGSFCTAGLSCAYYYNGLFIFCAKKNSNSSANGVGDVFSTTDFKNWTHIKNSTIYSWNDIIYSDICDTFLLGGENLSASENTESKGQLWKAAYKSLSNIKAYITSYNLAGTGYVKWSNGLLMQWTKKTLSNSSSIKWDSVTMPLGMSIAFYANATTGFDGAASAPFITVNGLGGATLNFMYRGVYNEHAAWFFEIGKA